MFLIICCQQKSSHPWRKFFKWSWHSQSYKPLFGTDIQCPQITLQTWLRNSLTQKGLINTLIFMWRNLVSKQIFTSNTADKRILLGLLPSFHLNENGNREGEKFHSRDDADMMNSFELNSCHVKVLLEWSKTHNFRVRQQMVLYLKQTNVNCAMCTTGQCVSHPLSSTYAN